MTYFRFLSDYFGTFISLLALTLFTTACSGEKISNDSETSNQKEIPAPKSWGPPEKTHIDFKSITASRECPLEKAGIRYIDPVPKLVDLARDYEIVMINEGHYKPVHRAFIGELAIALKDVGYGIYGAEAFDPRSFSKNGRNLDLVSRGYPVSTDGTSYMMEPVFGQLIETILREEYDVFAYENTKLIPSNAKSQIAHRDSEQAKNIFREYQKRSNKKMLIHAGYHHIKETKSMNEMWMAQYLKKTNNINPLTISQTDCYSKSAFDAGVLGYAMPIQEDGTPLTFDGYDVIIIPPLEAQYRDRPIWLKTSQGRHFIDVPKHLKRNDQFTKITAFDIKKIKGAVIEDTIYRPPFSDKPLALRPGTYRIEVTNQDKVILAEDEIRVP